jgi:prepilin-type N-terminal cleavage/methylation domain-containing protein
MIRRAFTQIELLVVIAVITLLLSIIVPSLKVAKNRTPAAACMSNQKSLSTAWNLCQETNGGFVTMSGRPAGSYWTWWDTPAFTHNEQSSFVIKY